MIDGFFIPRLYCDCCGRIIYRTPILDLSVGYDYCSEECYNVHSPYNKMMKEIKEIIKNENTD